MLVGTTNCAKSFMLKPLRLIYGDKCFENPANHKYGWCGYDKASVIILEDFRFSKDLISWKDFLLLLEGVDVSLPAPQNLYKDDVVITKPVAFFCHKQNVKLPLKVHITPLTFVKMT